MTSHSLCISIAVPPRQHIKGLSTFKRRGHLTDSTAQKNGTRVKGQGFLPARHQVAAALLRTIFPVDVKWKVFEPWQEGAEESLEGIARGEQEGENWSVMEVHTKERRGAKVRQGARGLLAKLMCMFLMAVSSDSQGLAQNSGNGPSTHEGPVRQFISILFP